MSVQQSHPISIGKKIEKLRKMRDMKQETLAEALGISRQSVSTIEHSEEIDDEKLEQIAKALGITVEAIKNFNEEATINYNQFNYEGSNKDAANVWVHNQNCTFNPMEKIVELYDALLKSEREKIALLESLLDKSKYS
jgi:transcriptional regulator with XRE-family HTH domain